MKQCQNPKCGKMFEPNPIRPQQMFCCKKCRQQAHNVRNYKKWKQDYLTWHREGKSRPLTRFSIYLIHKWHIEGLKEKEIAEILSRDIEHIKEALATPLTEKEKLKMEMYLKK